jgi:tripartite-type tricarboxylate transporter receptor subunit TctC
MRGAQRTLAALILSLVFTLVWWAPVSAQTSAQSWPQRSVRFILPLGPGSGADIGARLIADGLAKRWKEAVVVENRPGGDGLVAIGAFVNAKDDHILLFSPSSSFTAHPYLRENLPYQPGDLAPIGKVSNTVVAVSVNASMPVNSFNELVALIRSQPKKFNWAGITGAFDFVFESFLKETGLEMTKVPYRNPVEAANDLAEGRVQVYRSALAIAQPQLNAGKIKLLAVTNTMRSPAVPNIQTVTEAGHPSLAMDGLIGLFGPPSMPKELRERIFADIKAVMDADPTIAERLTRTGQIVNLGGPAEFAKAIDAQRQRISQAAKILGVKPKQ